MLKLFTRLTLIPFALGACQTASRPPLSDTIALSRIYPEYDQRNACWTDRKTADKPYDCYSIGSVNRVMASNGERTYILLMGVRIDADGKPRRVHVETGSIKAFVLHEGVVDKRSATDAPVLRLGAFRQPPSNWRFVRLGADIWGWMTRSFDCHQGHCASWLHILATDPRGEFRDVAGFPSSYNDQGYRERLQNDLKSEISILETYSGTPLFPLAIHVSGVKNGSSLQPRTWRIIFDSVSWSYRLPNDWPFQQPVY
ncbi:MAG: hypothetical protein AB7P12_11715 [Alphaproteobacteria bacterium]